MKIIRKITANRNVAAWLLMISVLGIHAFEESMTGFLPFYTQSVMTLRERLGFFPAPIFSYRVWFGGLITIIILCYFLTLFVARGGKVIRTVTTVFGVLMVGNALIHLVGSVYSGRVIPGMWSSPFILAAALFLIIQGLRGDWQIK